MATRATSIEMTGDASAFTRSLSRLNRLLGKRPDERELIKAQGELIKALQEQVEMARQLRVEMEKQNAITASVQGVGVREAQKALTHMISGQLGGMTAQKLKGVDHQLQGNLERCNSGAREKLDQLLSQALREALSKGHNYIGADHIREAAKRIED